MGWRIAGRLAGGQRDLQPRMTGIRLGYACVNTQLPSPARTARLANVTDERIAELVDANLGALEAILRWNRSRGIQVFRLTSNLIPFGSHPANTLPWWEVFADRFDRLGRLMRSAGMRISTHPGQYIVLSSIREDVVAAAIAEARLPRPAAERLRPRGLAQGRAPSRIRRGRSAGDLRSVRSRVQAALARSRRTARPRERRALAARHDARLGGAARAPGRLRRVPPRARSVDGAAHGTRARAPRRGDVDASTAARSALLRIRHRKSDRVHTRRRSTAMPSPGSPRRSVTCRSTASSR